jgi:hypothetical protein
MSKSIIKASSELMSNNKQATIMSAQNEFQVLQTREGHSMFFSIGTDNVFYLTREIPGKITGWERVDLSSHLMMFNDGNAVKAKTFNVAQNVATNKIDMVLAIVGDSGDTLYTALDLDNTDETWGKAISWVAEGFDADNKPSKLVINDIIVRQDSTEYIIVDILSNPDDPHNFLDRYYLDPGKKVSNKVWNKHSLPGNIQSGEVQSFIGRKAEALVDGIYTLGQINKKEELFYSPLYNAFDPSIPPNSAMLQIPPKSTAIAVAAAKVEGMTSLFVAGDSALYFFAYDNQEHEQSGQVVLNHPLFLNVKELHANNVADKVVIWGLNEQGQIFYTKCELGKESDTGSWSIPVPIMENVTQVATYLNNATFNNVIFAYTDDTNLVQLTQNPDTSIWSKRKITLPTTNVDDVITFNTYTTHIQVQREDNLPKDGEVLQITSVSPVSVYIDNVFHILSSDLPVEVTTDPTGTVTILQETTEIGVVCYSLKIKGSDKSIAVNPMLKLMDTIAEVKSGEELGKIKVTNADGSTQNLVPDSVSPQEKEATAQGLQQFVNASKTVPENGGVKSTPPPSFSNFEVTPDTIWGMDYRNGSATYYEGFDAMTHFGLSLSGNSISLRSDSLVLEDIGDAISSLAGDILNWLKNAWDDVTHFFVQLAGDVYHFFVEIGGKLYRFVLDCFHTILNTIEFVFNKIKVFFEDLIKWLGFLFQWKDILRTHDALKNIFNKFLYHSVDQIDVLKNNVDKIFDNIQERIDEWAGLKDLSGSLSEKSTAQGNPKGKDNPQSNYGAYHMKNGVRDSSTNTNIISGVASQLEQLLQELMAAAGREEAIFENAYENFKTQVIDEAATLSMEQLLKRSLAIVADIIVESVENMVDTALDIIKILMNGVIEIFNAKLDIPVLSWLYKLITGNELSFMDAACLVLAIPATLIYKITFNKAPFPDNETTHKIITAQSWKELRAIYSPLTASNTEEHSDLQKGLIITCRIAAGISSFVFIVTNTAKAAISASLPSEESKSASIANGVFFYLTTGPNVAASLIASDGEQRWDTIVGEVVYGATCLEKLVDVFTYQSDESPAMKTWGEATKVIDCILGVCGLIPTFAPLGYKQDTITITGAITNTLWNANRIMTPFAGLATAPEAFAVKMGLIGFYGIGQFVLAVEEGVINEEYVLIEC